MGIFTKTITTTNNWVGRITGFLLLPILFSTIYEVVARYFFNSPTIWAMELNTYLFCAYCLLGGGYTLLRGGHVSIDILFEHFSSRTKGIFNCLTSIFTFMFCIVILKYGWDMASMAIKFNETSGSILDWPMAPVMLMVPLGALLLFLQAAVKFKADLKTAISGESQEEKGGLFADPTKDLDK